MAKKMQSVFERYEVKYLLDKGRHDDLLKELDGRMQVDDYGLTTICNIYFDTPDHRLVRESIEKPIYKEKLRLRCYGVPDDDTPAFIELKKKFNGVVYKRRISMPYKQAYEYLVNGKTPHKQGQIFNEIEWVRSYYNNVRPAMALCYDRIALYGIEDPELRITIDTNLRFRNDDLDLEDGAWGNELMCDGRYIMEIKAPLAMPLWLSEVLDKLKIYPASYSKYGAAYTDTISKKEVAAYVF